MSPSPYYQDDLVTLFCCDFRDLPLDGRGATMVTDPPYGIAYRSGKDGSLARSIVNDDDTSARTDALAAWSQPALVFGSWKVPPPRDARACLVWDKGPALGMGDTTLPWKPSWDLIYVIGRGFTGRRGGGVLRFPPVQSMARNGRTHPHEKPVPLMKHLIERCPPGGIVDPFAGTGATLVAAKALGRWAIGVEIDEAYCERAALRLSQETLGLTA